MNPISAADNHTIVTTNTRWRLLYTGQPMAEATSNSFRYGKRFSLSRRLPDDGYLAPDRILQVVLGWQHTDEAWHLGLILTPALANERGSRWVELASWPDPDITVFQDLAEQTGRSLAQVLAVPFYSVPPQPMAKAAVVKPLPELPMSFGVWTIERVSQDQRRFVIRRDRSWVWQKYGRIAWNAFWMVIYLLLSVATLTSDIALPNTGTLFPDPHILPYLGLLTAVLLLGIMGYNLWEIVRLPDRFFIDGVERTISAWTNRKIRWQIQAVDIQSVYISEVVKKKDTSLTTEYGELNLHLGGGQFRFVLAHQEPEANANFQDVGMKSKRQSDMIREITADNVQSNLQTAALYITQALGDIVAWYDLRVK